MQKIGDSSAAHCPLSLSLPPVLLAVAVVAVRTFCLLLQGRNHWLLCQSLEHCRTLQ
jgi:hypothetical protein